jgi:protein phosphatase
VTQPDTPSPAPPEGGQDAAAEGSPPAGASPPAAAGSGATPGSGSEVRVKLFARTDVGQVREHNEDNFLVADLTRRSRGLMEASRSAAIGPHGDVFAVCDGMGGAAAGEIASQLAVDIIYEHMVEGLEKTPASSRDDLARRLVHSVEAAGLRIFQEAKLDRTRRGMGTTVTASALVDDHVFFAQVGDSRGYILRGGVLTQVTRDQSLVNQLIEAGQLTEEEAETFEHNNIILQALGTADTVQVDLTYVELRRGDMMLLCSDGLSGMVRFDEIRDIMRGSQEPLDICKALTERANQAGGHDNITVIIVVFDGESLQPLTSDIPPLKYRKYSLPEPPEEDTESFRRARLMTPPTGETALPPGPETATDPAVGSLVKADGASVKVPSKAPSARPPGSTGQPWQEHGPHDEGEERIEIPGTHVPAWVVVAIVVGVVALLAATAFFLLR